MISIAPFFAVIKVRQQMRCSKRTLSLLLSMKLWMRAAVMTSRVVLSAAFIRIIRRNGSMLMKVNSWPRFSMLMSALSWPDLMIAGIIKLHGHIRVVQTRAMPRAMRFTRKPIICHLSI